MVNDSNQSNQRLLDVKEVADRLNYSQKRIREFLNSNILHGDRVGPRKKWLIPESEITRFQEGKNRIPQTDSLISKIEEKYPKESDEITDEAKKHDIEVFKKLDEIMNDRDYFAFFFKMSAGHSISDEIAFKLDKFAFFANLESNKYCINSLKKSFNNFWDQYCDLEEYISIHTFTSDRESNTLEIMPFVHREGMTNSEVYDYFNKLHKLIEATEKAYRQYRASIREILYI